VGVAGFEPTTSGLASHRSHGSSVSSRKTSLVPSPEGSTELHAHWFILPIMGSKHFRVNMFQTFFDVNGFGFLRQPCG